MPNENVLFLIPQFTCRKWNEKTSLITGMCERDIKWKYKDHRIKERHESKTIYIVWPYYEK